SGGVPVPAPTQLLSGLALQTDLRTIDNVDPNYQVYENAAWAPMRAVLPASARAASQAPASGANQVVQNVDLGGALPVLTGGGPDRVSGPVPGGSIVYSGTTRSGRWQLAAAGRTAKADPAFGWAMTFRAPGSGGFPVSARLSYRAPFLLRAGQLVAIVLWVGAVGLVVVDRRQRSRAEQLGAGCELPDPAWFVPTAAPPPRSARPALRRSVRAGPRRESTPPVAVAEPADGAWTDV
ncbi:MAG: hypothetical protein JO337_10335, partial [Acidimicrobiales bacterium]|nr:hypothetical protein [Acidimicrobiales bacterium]